MQKRALSSVLILGSVFWLASSFCLVRAEDESGPSAKSKQTLVDLKSVHNADRVRDLERRSDDQERELRSQDERIRNLERTVNDLRRER